jgi:dihydrofolate synthase / folylpolyglutamate synthase
VTYNEAVQFLYSLGNEVHTAKLGLDRITRLLHSLGDPHHSCKFVHVAGTNGKGSTCAMIEAGLRASGIRTGLYTSPHLVEPTERIQIDGAPVSRLQFAEAFNQVHQAAISSIDSGDLEFHPTYFETVTAMAFLLFRQEGIDRAVVEVGLGGRLDATNVVTPELCVITPIDFDHQVFLGDTIQQIATEKAGILKTGVPAVFSSQSPDVAAVLRACAKGPYFFAQDWPAEELRLDARSSRFRLQGFDVCCPLAGEHQVDNARTAAIALHQLGVAPDGIAKTLWPGRLEQIAARPAVILDGAHNPAGTRALVRYIQRFYSDRRMWLVYAVMRDKAINEIVGLLFPLAHRIILTRPANARAMDPEDIPAPHAIVTHHVSEALELVNDVPPDDVVFITGSLFVVGEARALLVK